MKVSRFTAGARLICPGRAYRKPKISIVTPTYRRNAEGLLAKCLDSAMAQTFDDFEHVVIDDGSSDGSEFTIREAAFRDDRIVYVRHEANSGLPAVRTNEGVMRARGEAVAFLFDDNIFQPDFIETAWNALQASGADVAHANVHMFAMEGKDFTLGGWPLTLELLRNLNTIPNGGVMVRRSFFDRYGLYDPHILMRRICDWDLWLRALALGAKYCHVEKIGAVEYGLRSANSIGNTVAWDVKVACAYMLDDRYHLDRSHRLRPEAIPNYDVFDSAPVRRYVRNAREWAELVDTVYRPFIERHGANGFDPEIPENRAAGLDPQLGWNADWSLIAERRRYLVVSNSINAWASAWLHALRQQPGAIVANCPEWQLSSFRPVDLDLLVLLDCTAAFLKIQLEGFRAAGVPILYVLGHGEQASNAVPAALINRQFASSAHITDLLGPEFYFPQTGACFTPALREGAQALAAGAYAAVAARGDAERMGLADAVWFPFDTVTPCAPSSANQGTHSISYFLDGSKLEDTAEIVILPKSSYLTTNGTVMRPSWEGLGALAECRPGSRIVVDDAVLEASPLAERVGLAALARRHDVAITTAGAEHPDEGGKTPPGAWLQWMGNVARGALVARQIALARGMGPARPRIGIFLNSEMFSGSEIYGLMLARALRQIGFRVQVFIPQSSVYGAEADSRPLNQWLQANALEQARRAPYSGGAGYLRMDAAAQSTTVGQLSAFVREQKLDSAICSGFLPEFAALPDPILLFMALFQPSGYPQKQLAFLRGKVSGVISDSRWSLAAHRRLLGGPTALVRPTQIDIAAPPPKVPRTSGPVRIALGGTLQPRKRQLEAVRAIGLLRDRGIALQLNIYGYRLDMLQSYLNDIDRTIAALHLQGLVTCHGLVPPHRMVQENDIVLSASIDESLPQTLVELMRGGLIGVAGLSGGIDELIEDGKTGYLTTDLSPHGVADVLQRAIEHRERWPEVARNAGALVEREYSIGENTTALIDLLIEAAQLESSPFGRLAPVSA